jgi:catechol 2,3-dioxygenase-like lactoylglutathione lyase family enzyme
VTAGARLARVIVSVADLERALRLYRDVLGLEGQAGGGFARLALGEVELLLHERESVPSDLSVAAGILVADVDATVAAWVAAGGSVVDEPADQPWGERMAVVRDADGHLVCLVGR